VLLRLCEGPSAVQRRAAGAPLAGAAELGLRFARQFLRV